MNASDECYEAIKACAMQLVAAQPVRFRIAINEDDSTTETQLEAHEFLKVDGVRWGRDFKLYGLMATVSGFAGAGLVDFAEVLMAVKGNIPEAFAAVRETVESWDRFFDEGMRSDWKAMWA